MADWALPGANALLGGTAMPTTLYVQAHTGDPGQNGTSNVSSDTRRVQITLGTASGGAASSNADAEVSAWVATETITHVSYWSASSGGTCWFIDDNTNVDINSGEVLSIAQGQAAIILPLWGT